MGFTRKSTLLNRRHVVGGGLASLLVSPAIAQDSDNLRSRFGNPTDIEWLDPMAPMANYERIRHLFQEPADVYELVKIIWERFDRSGDIRYGEWALSYSFMWWQTLPPGGQRIKAAQVGRILAEHYMRADDKGVVGPFWWTMFKGSEALARGVVDSLHMLREFIPMLDQVEERDPSYLYGAVHMVRAKLLAKLPPFPMSYGNVKKAAQMIERCREYNGDRVGLYYITRAEIELQLAGEQRALQTLDELQTLCPSNLFLGFNYEMGLFLADKFRQALAADKYDKYTWDPLLESIRELVDASYPPTPGCGSGG